MGANRQASAGNLLMIVRFKPIGIACFPKQDSVEILIWSRLWDGKVEVNLLLAMFESSG